MARGGSDTMTYQGMTRAGRIGSKLAGLLSSDSERSAHHASAPDPEERMRACAHERTIHRVSSKGVAARMELYRDIDDGIKSAWTVDLVELHTDDGPSGYLKISYVPEELADTYFPDAFAYSVWELGRHNWQLRAQLLQPQEKWNREQLLKAFAWTDGFRTSEADLDWREQASDQELLKAWELRRRELGDEASAEYERFKNFHVDKPLIDYVRVSSGAYDQHYQDGKRVQDHGDDTDYRHQGLATLMYETAAIWMRSRGMKLHASGVQSDDAVGVWKSFEARGLIEEAVHQRQTAPEEARTVLREADKRRVFAVDKLLEADPDLAF